MRLQVLLQVGKRSLGMIYYRNLTRLIDAICKTQQMHSKHNMCSREYDWEEIEKSLISNGSW